MSASMPFSPPKRHGHLEPFGDAALRGDPGLGPIDGDDLGDAGGGGEAFIHEASDMAAPLPALADLIETGPPVGTAVSVRARGRRIPWLTSLLIHGSLLAAGLFVLSLARAERRPPADPVLIAQPLTAAHGFRAGGILHVGPGRDALTPVRQVRQKLLRATGWRHRGFNVPLSSLLAGAQGRHAAFLIGMGSSPSAADMPGLAPVHGAIAPFGVAGAGDGPGMKSRFAGHGGNARRIVYILDRSGSMIDKFPILRRAAVRSIRRLIPFQRFAVIVFARHEKLLGPPRLLRATGRNRRAVVAALNALAPLDGGGNDDRLRPFLTPLKNAFVFNAQIVYFFTDGHFDRQLPADVLRLNRKGRAHIFTYAFPSLNRRSTRLLARMARQNGGTFGYVK